MKVQVALWTGRAQIPELDGVVERSGEKGVIAGAELERGDLVGVTLEVTNIRIVVGGEIADVVIELC